MNMDFLAKLAPTVFSALLGPLGGVAASALGDLLGVSDATQVKIEDAIRAGQLTPEQLSKIKELELKYQADEQERGFRYAELAFKTEELAVTDRDGARKRESDVKDNTNRILAYTIVGSFIAVVGATLMGYAKIESVLAGTLVGYLSAKAEQVLAYYFGSTSGSSRKTELLANSQPVK
jgi:hypothetical protein